MIARRREPGALDGADVAIEILDSDDEGPAFAASALDALTAAGGPLAGLRVSVERRAYDWNDAASLGRRLRSIVDSGGDSVGVVIASEGGCSSTRPTTRYGRTSAPYGTSRPATPSSSGP